METLVSQNEGQNGQQQQQQQQSRSDNGMTTGHEDNTTDDQNVHGEGTAGSASGGPSVNGGLHLTSADLNPNMDDVMKVIKDLDDDFETDNGNESTNRNVANTDRDLNSVQEVSKIVDRATLAEEKYKELSNRQIEIEDRFKQIQKRLDTLRLRHLGNIVANEISTVRQYCRELAPPPPPPAPKINPFALVQPPKNMPEGVVLPSVPSTEVLIPSATTVTSSSASGSKIKRESGDMGRIVKLTANDKRKVDEALGQASSHLSHLIHSYDSDATESSSGGDSCDEMDGYSGENPHYVPIKKRAKWTWLANRANIASKWTWLSAEISDLNYRIYQQKELYRQKRSGKGSITLGEPVVSWPPHARKPVLSVVRPDQDVPMSCNPVTKDYSRVDATGRKIIIKEPPPNQTTQSTTAQESSKDSESDDNSLGACRTRPLKTVKRRKILQTKGLHQHSIRFAKESTVHCGCNHPSTWCAICLGRRSHTQTPDPLTQEQIQCIALLDHSYHQILSTEEDTPLQLKMMQMVKNGKWMNATSRGQSDKLGDSDFSLLKKKIKKLKEEGEKQDESGKKLKKKIPAKRDKDGKIIKKSKKSDGKARRKSLSVNHGDETTMTGFSSDDGDTLSGADGSPIPSPSVSMSNHAWAEHIRRKRETAFDINNIVIPYSIAASTRVEKLKYKEILTPTWRNVNEDQMSTSTSEKPSSEEIKNAQFSPSELEDVADVSYEQRHAKAEIEEKKRWQLPVNKSSGAQRSRSRSIRQDSCRTEASSGCNTPDPLSPGMVDKVDTLEVTTRPTTPVNTPTEEVTPTATPTTAASIRYRRRTSSTTKSRDRNPSEDTQSSRCTTPVQEQHFPHQLQKNLVEMVPFDSRNFPLSEDEYKHMLEDMPQEHSFPPQADEVFKKVKNTSETKSDAVKSESQAIKQNESSASPSGVVNASGRLSPVGAEEDNDEDPEWKNMDDPKDPEWNEENVSKVNTSGTKSDVSKSSKSGVASRKGNGLTLKMPKDN